MPQAGSYRHRVNIVESSATPDGLGGGTRTTQTLATVWAVIDPIRGNERQVADALRAQVSHLVTIRYPHSFTVTSAMRVTWQDPIAGLRTFYIRGIVETSMIQRTLQLQCEEGE